MIFMILKLAGQPDERSIMQKLLTKDAESLLGILMRSDKFRDLKRKHLVSTVAQILLKDPRLHGEKSRAKHLANELVPHRKRRRKKK